MSDKLSELVDKYIELGEIMDEYLELEVEFLPEAQKMISQGKTSAFLKILAHKYNVHIQGAEFLREISDIEKAHTSRSEAAENERPLGARLN